jgi:hypothetical protein
MTYEPSVAATAIWSQQSMAYHIQQVVWLVPSQEYMSGQQLATRDSESLWGRQCIDETCLKENG